MSEEKPPEKPSSPWKDRGWKILLALLVPLAALVAKDIYDYAKTVADPSRANPPAAVQKQPEKQADPARLIGSGSLPEKAGQILSQLPLPKPGAESTDDKKLPMPLIIAARNGRVIAVELLLSQGADVNARDKSNGATALIVAAREGHLQIVELLLKKGADVNASDSSGNTALSEASRNQRTEVANLLKEHGAK